MMLKIVRYYWESVITEFVLYRVYTIDGLLLVCETFVTGRRPVRNEAGVLVVVSIKCDHLIRPIIGLVKYTASRWFFCHTISIFTQINYGSVYMTYRIFFFLFTKDDFFAARGFIGIGKTLAEMENCL